MSTVVIMPGGFHPFHAGHMALYDSARKAFPGAEVFVAATNDTSNRPFPFAIKEKLAKLAGVQPGHFVQVKSPFRAEEITAKFNPDKDRLIFVRSEKDADKPPQAGGVKKNGEPAYLQLLNGQTNIAPFGKHAYMAYLPTVEFGPGMTSATEIRNAWPQLNEKRKTALVMSLYPQTQQNPALAANVVKMLDTAIGSELAESNMLGHVMFKSKPPKLKKIQPAVSRTKDFMKRDFSLSEDELNEFVPGDDNGGDDDDGENFLEATFVIYKGSKRQTGTVRIYPNITVDVEYYLDGKVYIKNNMENVGDYDDFIENAAGYIREIVQLKGDGHHFVEQGVAENQGTPAIGGNLNKNKLNELAPNANGGNGPFDYGTAIIRIGEDLIDFYQDEGAGADSADIIQVGKTFISAGMTKGIAALFDLDSQVYDHVLDQLADQGFNVKADIYKKRQRPAVSPQAQDDWNAYLLKRQAQLDATPGEMYVVTGWYAGREYSSVEEKIKAVSPEEAKKKFLAQRKTSKFRKIDVETKRERDARGDDWETRANTSENQGWAATFTNETNAQNFVGGMTAGYQQRENQPVDEKKESKFRDAELLRTKQFVKTHYPTYDPDTAFEKWIQRSLKHSEQEDKEHDQILARLVNKVDVLSKKLNRMQNNDYIEEKWSQKYKSSINCANPKGFSQRAHCAGRKKNESTVQEEVAPAYNYAQIKAMPPKERQAYLRANPEIAKLFNAEWQKAIDAKMNNFSWMTPEEQAQYEKLVTLDAGKSISTKSYKAEKYLKQLFQKKVDAKKAASMLKVHWAPLSDLSKYLEGQVSPKVELSAYLAASPQDLGKVRWGNGTVGIVLDGHITIAGREDLGSDQYKMTAGQRGQQKYPNRPGQIDPSFSSIDLAKHHEVLIDNWKIREIVLPADIPQNVDAVIQQYGIPVRRLQA